MDIYNLTKTARDAGFAYGFNIIGVHGRPLVHFSYERHEEAEAAHDLIAEAVAKAKLITPMT